ncbi:hypothetical protein JTB14_009338 [Gonioctena quinquepunctata]|nr:hypothetical protein JTB14_009338 [Gonioctena quinquepunctata]
MKQEAEEKQRKIKAKEVKRNLMSKGKTSQKQRAKNRTHVEKNAKPEVSSDEEEFFCLVCLGPYNSSRPGENWVQCLGFKLWSHEDCTKKDPFHMCRNCESD